MDRKHISILPDCVPLCASDGSVSSSRFLRLPHPRTCQPALFLPYKREADASTTDGILEVSKIQLDADKQRSWFLEQEVVSDGNLSIFAPFDPIFFVLSYLSALPNHFVSYSDLWETVSQHRFASPTAKGGKDQGGEHAPFADDIVRLSQLDCVKARLEKVCETQVYDSTTLYRLSQSLVLDVLKAKVDALADSIDGIFGTLESTEPGEHRNAVEAVKPFPTVSRGMAREGAGGGQGLNEQIQRESRQKYAVGIIANYLPPALTHSLLSAYEFSALSIFLSANTTSAFLGTTYLPGRGSSKSESDLSTLGGGNAAAAAKKRKLEAKGSRGVEALKKVNTKGMKSLAEMFGKQATAGGSAAKSTRAATAAAAKGKKK
ncbi:hypothetical protein JCM16303_007099 [Sporobolomyces ruberrimus]